jgi:hypothetical protein
MKDERVTRDGWRGPTALCGHSARQAERRPGDGRRDAARTRRRGRLRYDPAVMGHVFHFFSRIYPDLPGFTRTNAGASDG